MVQLSYIAVDQSFQCQKPVELDSDNNILFKGAGTLFESEKPTK